MLCWWGPHPGRTGADACCRRPDKPCVAAAGQAPLPGTCSQSVPTGISSVIPARTCTFHLLSRAHSVWSSGLQWTLTKVTPAGWKQGRRWAHVVTGWVGCPQPAAAWHGGSSGHRGSPAGTEVPSRPRLRGVPPNTEPGSPAAVCPVPSSGPGDEKGGVPGEDTWGLGPRGGVCCMQAATDGGGHQGGRWPGSGL